MNKCWHITTQYTALLYTNPHPGFEYCAFFLPPILIKDTVVSSWLKSRWLASLIVEILLIRASGMVEDDINTEWMALFYCLGLFCVLLHWQLLIIFLSFQIWARQWFVQPLHHLNSPAGSWVTTAHVTLPALRIMTKETDHWTTLTDSISMLYLNPSMMMESILEMTALVRSCW